MNGNCERSEMQDKTLADLENGLRKNRINTGFPSIYAVFKKWSPRDGTRTPKIIVLRDYVVLRIAV